VSCQTDPKKMLIIYFIMLTG